MMRGFSLVSIHKENDCEVLYVHNILEHFRMELTKINIHIKENDNVFSI